HALDLIYGRNYLQTESHVRKFTVVLRNVDKTSVGRRTEALQEVLCEFELKTRIQRWTHRGETAICRGPAVVKTDRKVGAPLKALSIGKVCRRRSLQRAGKRTRGNKIGVI